MTEYRYTESHEWIAKEDGEWKVGITDHAQEELGDITFVDLPDPGTELTQGADFGMIESVKTVSELYSPSSGEVKAINEIVVQDPSLVNSDPEGEGFLLIIEVADESELDGLMDEEEYAAYLEEEA